MMRMSRMLVLNIVIVMGLLGALVPLSAAAQDADGTGTASIDSTSQTSDTDQTTGQLQGQVPDQDQLAEQINQQVDDLLNDTDDTASADAHADDAAMTDTSASSDIGESTQANANPQTGTNQTGQDQEVVGGTQTNTPSVTNTQDTSYNVSDVGGDVDTSTNVTVENVLNNSGNVDDSGNTTVTVDLSDIGIPGDPEPLPDLAGTNLTSSGGSFSGTCEENSDFVRFTTSGQATGPYAGTFEESGFIGLWSTEDSLLQFTIDAENALVTGTKRWNEETTLDFSWSCQSGTVQTVDLTMENLQYSATIQTRWQTCTTTGTADLYLEGYASGITTFEQTFTSSEPQSCS